MADYVTLLRTAKRTNGPRNSHLMLELVLGPERRRPGLWAEAELQAAELQSMLVRPAIRRINQALRVSPRPVGLEARVHSKLWIASWGVHPRPATAGVAMGSSKQVKLVTGTA